MRRQLQTPSHLKVASGPVALPQRYLGAETVVVNHYAGTEKLIPTIPGFRTSAGMFSYPQFFFPRLLRIVVPSTRGRVHNLGSDRTPQRCKIIL